ncbi:hypothetical protein TNCV_1071911 [Trichonephila clavipes]|nr:hypothetical protein TNCV_1071911 [Trichonephila clavipes]
MASGSYMTPIYSRSQSEVQGDLHNCGTPFESALLCASRKSSDGEYSRQLQSLHNVVAGRCVGGSNKHPCKVQQLVVEVVTQESNSRGQHSLSIPFDFAFILQRN